MRENLSCPPKIVHFTQSINPRYGGPPQSVVNMLNHLGELSWAKYSLVAQGHEYEPRVPLESSNVESLIYGSKSALLMKLGIPALRAISLIQSKGDISLIHVHGLWLPMNHWAAKTALKQRVPLVIHPRGMLEAWSLNYHKYRKSMATYQRKDLAGATCFVATSEMEYESIRRVGFTQPIAVIPNGVVLPLSMNLCPVQSKTPSSRTALFLSRIHPKKGLLDLLNAWRGLNPEGWRLVIAGPDDGGYRGAIEAKIIELELTDTVICVGEVQGAQKEQLFLEAELFVLPTFSENFGIVIAEALSYGLPVITTEGAPWSELVDNRCGWWVPVGEKSIHRALESACSMDASELRRMGKKGKEYVRKFNWNSVAQETEQLYKWVLYQGERPGCVIID
jgi:glycosyltransferase involved in cell wall biosynthesis